MTSHTYTHAGWILYYRREIHLGLTLTPCCNDHPFDPCIVTLPSSKYVLVACPSHGIRKDQIGESLNQNHA